MLWNIVLIIINKHYHSYLIITVPALSLPTKQEDRKSNRIRHVKGSNQALFVVPITYATSKRGFLKKWEKRKIVRLKNLLKPVPGIYANSIK